MSISKLLGLTLGGYSKRVVASVPVHPCCWRDPEGQPGRSGKITSEAGKIYNVAGRPSNGHEFNTFRVDCRTQYHVSGRPVRHLSKLVVLVRSFASYSLAGSTMKSRHWTSESATSTAARVPSFTQKPIVHYEVFDKLAKTVLVASIFWGRSHD